jgi:glycosyltransferase involved in cell wall biosynthesis
MVSISVITPSLNQGDFIERTLNSVLDQHIPELEYVVFDGGSNDETLDILRRYKDRVRWVSEPDHGQAHAVNKGIAATKGEIIAWINSDDIYFPGTLAKVQQYFTENPSVDVLYGDAFHIDLNDNRFEPYPTELWDFERLKIFPFLCQPAVFFRRRVVMSFGGVDESLHFCMDYEYWLRLAMGGTLFAYMPEPLAGSRMYAENKTLSQRVPVHAEINDMLKKKLGKVPARWLFGYATVFVDERYNLNGIGRLTFIFMQSLLASIRWNHGISRDFFILIANWFRIQK